MATGDLADQIRAWGDAVEARGGESARAEDILDSHLPTGRSAARSPLRPHRQHRRLVLATVVCVTIAVTAMAIGRARNDTPDRVSTGGSGITGGGQDSGREPSGEVTFDLLGMHDAVHDQMGTVRSASTPRELAALWSDAGLAPPTPIIDFDRQVVVSITIPDDACPPTLEAFDRGGSTIAPRFVETAPGCNKPLIPKTYVAAIDWASTGPSFRVFLKGQPNYDFVDTYLEVRRPGSEGPEPQDGTCPVTRPPKPGLTVPDGWPARPPSGLWYGTVDLWTVLPSDGSSPAPRKSVWWSANFRGGSDEPRPDIAVTWQRLDKPADPVRTTSGTNASIPDVGSFMIAGIDPPSAGCWRVTASYRGASLSYVYRNPPRLWVQSPSSKNSPSEGPSIEGRLSYDETNNCFFLEQPGQRFPVVWPAGTTVSTTGATITSPDGRRIGLGDQVAGRGGYHPAGDEPVHDVPPACLPATKEVAVFEPDADLRITD